MSKISDNLRQLADILEDLPDDLTPEAWHGQVCASVIVNVGDAESVDRAARAIRTTVERDLSYTRAIRALEGAYISVSAYTPETAPLPRVLADYRDDE